MLGLVGLEVGVLIALPCIGNVSRNSLRAESELFTSWDQPPFSKISKSVDFNGEICWVVLNL